MTSEALEWVKRNRPDITPAEELDGVCGVKECNRPQMDTFPVCEDHAFDIWVEVGFLRMDMHKAAAAHMRKVDVQKIKNELIEEALGVIKFKEERQQTPGVIYYLQVEDLIKIGFTRDLHGRLRAYPPMARLLATHPGTFQLEGQMHKKFAHHLADRKEWFTVHVALLEHIERVRKEFKQDKLVTA